MFAISMQSLAANSIPLNWFDGVVVLVLVFGVLRGRKNGMSKEILPLSEWFSVIFICGLFYSLIAPWIQKLAGTGVLMANILGYVGLALVIFLFFSMIKRPLGERLFGSNLFGNAEYYLGMPSGIVRYCCVLLFALSFLNARHYTPAQIQAGNDFQQRWYGSHFFPDLYTVQDAVFHKSFTGPYIKKYLSVLMIEPTTSGDTTLEAASPPPSQ
jgi:uncharacterized membrane protein required for colicin V production